MKQIIDTFIIAMAIGAVLDFAFFVAFVWYFFFRRSDRAEVAALRNAIRKHRDQRGDDRCWLDDEDLYKELPEGYEVPARDTAVELENCNKFLCNRRNPSTKYDSPQRRIEEYEMALRFYADGQGDQGKRAQAALGHKSIVAEGDDTAGIITAAAGGL